MTRRLVALCVTLAACGAPRPTIQNVRPGPAADVPAPVGTTAPADRELPPWLAPEKPGRRVVTSTSITILDRIGYLGATAVLDPISFPMLDAIAATLDGNPSIELMEVLAWGSDGPPTWQQRLGLQRALAVTDYLIAKGVDRARLRAHGEAIPEPGRDNRPSFLIVRRSSDH